MSLKQVLQPAVELAANGFPVSHSLASSLLRYSDRLTSDPATKGYFYKPDGGFYRAGELLVQKDQTATYCLFPATEGMVSTRAEPPNYWCNRWLKMAV